MSFARTSRLPIAAGDDEKRRRDRLRVQPEHHLQHQRRAHARLDRRMRAGEHQRQPPIGNLRTLRRCRLQALGEHLQLARRSLRRACRRAASITLRRATVSSQRLRIRRTAVARPIRQRRSERLRQRVLRRRDVARARREKGDELAVAAARDRIRRACVAFFASRTSLMRPPLAMRYICPDRPHFDVPWPAPGQRAAHAIAASRSGTSIR